MKSAATSGWAMNAACEPATDIVIAFILLAMKRWASGWMALSCSDTMYHAGRFFQPEVAFSVKAASGSDRRRVPLGSSGDSCATIQPGIELIPYVSTFGEADRMPKCSESEGVRNMVASADNNGGLRPACYAGGRASRTGGAGARQAAGVFGSVQAEDSEILDHQSARITAAARDPRAPALNYAAAATSASLSVRARRTRTMTMVPPRQVNWESRRYTCLS